MLVISTGANTASSGRWSCGPHDPGRPAGVACDGSSGVAAGPAMSIGTGPAASARRDYGSGTKNDGAHLPHLWASRPARALSLARALPAVRDLLAPLRGRAPAAPAATAGAPAAPL